MITKTRLTVTIDHKLMDMLQEKAKADSRTLSNYVEVLLYEALRRREEE